MFLSGGTVWRPVPEPENKKPSGSGKTENEGIHDPLKNRCSGLASSFSLTEKLAPNAAQAFRLSRMESHDEHRQTDILTSGVKPYSRLPGL